MWARVMNVATRGHEAKWLERPKGVVAVQVCRVSGKLPDEGCSAVDVVRNNGELETRSMVHTEYFASGTAPTAMCDLHPARSWTDQVADVLGGAGSRPVGEAELALPPVVPAPVAPASEPSADTGETGARKQEGTPSAGAEARPAKRGFWGRLFGRREPEDTRKAPAKEADRPRPRKPPPDPR
jgi:penicillin-binding protein 1A